MNYKMMGRFIAQIVFIEALFLIPALIISLGYWEIPAVKAFAITLGIMLTLAGLLYLLCRKAGRLFGAQEGLVCVSLSWIVMSLLGALPFVLSGNYPNYIDALFEIVSGFTTTGSSVMANVEGLYRGILYWRYGRAGISAGHPARQSGRRLYHASSAGRKPRPGCG